MQRQTLRGGKLSRHPQVRQLSWHVFRGLY